MPDRALSHCDGLELEALKKVRELEDRKIGYLRQALSAKNNSFPGGKVRMGANGNIGSRQVELLNDNSLSSYPLNIQSSLIKQLAPTPTLITQLRFGKQGHTTPSSSVPFAPHKRGRIGKQAAFTLAEVLITLGIIGVVAALTLPTLIQNYKEKTTVTWLKKFYSSFEQSVRIMWNEEGSNNIYNPNALLKTLKTLKICEGTTEGCTNVKRKSIDQKRFIQFGAGDIYQTSQLYIILESGALLRMTNINQKCTQSSFLPDEYLYCGEIAVDINGDAKPNITGQDIFYFMVSQKGIIPYGIKGTKTEAQGFSGCDPNKLSDGYGCAAWVIQNENMDYLKCKDQLSWDGQHKCK